MNKTLKSKKGFTLAELLIVVAIIAVLVAIAVPLFVGAIQKAEEATFNANMRSLKGMAVTALLGSENYNAKTDEGPWYAECTINADGTLSVDKWVAEGTQTTYETYTKPTTDTPAKVTVVITKSTITDYTKPAAGSP